MKEMAEMKKIEGDDEGIMFNIHDRLRELVTEQYERIEGRCEICLEELAVEGSTDSSHLVSLDGCFHRFHLLCVHRHWFMERQAEEDSYGLKIEYHLPSEHNCALCLHPVDSVQVSKIKASVASQPTLDDGGYT